MAVIPKASTLVRLHQALVKRKYHLLYGSNRPRRPGPKGPSSELIAAVVEMKRRNPRLGCRKIAEQISSAFGLELNKDVVRLCSAKLFVCGDPRTTKIIFCSR